MMGIERKIAKNLIDMAVSGNTKYTTAVAVSYYIKTDDKLNCGLFSDKPICIIICKHL